MTEVRYERITGAKIKRIVVDTRETFIYCGAIAPSGLNIVEETLLNKGLITSGGHIDEKLKDFPWTAIKITAAQAARIVRTRDPSFLFDKPTEEDKHERI